MTRYLVAAHFEIIEGSFADFIEGGRKVASASVKDEEGCERYDVLVSSDGRPQGTMFEVYRDKSDHQAHQETPHFSEFWKVTANHRVIWTVDFGGLDRQSEFETPR